MSYIEDNNLDVEVYLENEQEIAYMEKNKECFKCGAEAKVSKKGNLFCSKLCWIDPINDPPHPQRLKRN